MTFSHLPAFLATCFTRLATTLDARTALHGPATVADPRSLAYRTTAARGHRRYAHRTLRAVHRRCRTAPQPHPSPGPAGQKFVYGHSWVTLAALAKHPERGTIALPLLNQLYIRNKDIDKLDADRRPPFLTKLELAADSLRWVAEVLVAVPDRGALEETNKDVKEVWGADEQQVRNREANVGCFNLNGWMYSVVEAWSWQRSDEVLVDRRGSPWDDACRRPSHADKRKALRRELLRGEIEAVVREGTETRQLQALAEKLLALAI